MKQFILFHYILQIMILPPRIVHVPVIFLLCSFSLYPEIVETVFSGDALPVWRQALGGAVIGAPAIQAGSVAMVLDGGNIRVYTLDGKELWDYYAKGKLAPSVTRSREGTCYMYRVDGTFIAVNRAGRELWKLRLETLNKGEKGVKAETLSGPILSGWDGRIFIPLGRIIFCYTASGYKLWSVELRRLPVLGPVQTKSGGLIMVLENGELTGIDHLGAARSTRLDEIPAALIPVENGTLVLFKNGSGRFFSTRAEDAPVHLPNLGGIPLGGAAYGNGAAIALSGGRLVHFSLRDGKINWTGESHAQNGPLEVLYDERGVYVFTKEGASGFTADGRRLWLFRIKGAASIPALSDEGVLYTGGGDWILYAYKLENRALKRRVSLYGPLSEGSYGLGNPPPSPWAAFGFQEAAVRERLAGIALHIRRGSVGEDEAAYTAYLMEVSGSVLIPKTSQVRPPVHVRERAEAARLLGYIGSRETIAFLSELFTKDPDPAVKAAAAAAIGRIGTDPDGTALAAFTGAALAAWKDEQTLIAAAEAAGSLCRFSGPPLSESGVKLLTLLASGGMPAKIRTQAKRELDRLK